MKHLIDKDKTIAEIERFKKEEGWCQVGKDTADVYYARGFRFACERIINVLDTFEVKEVDLKKEIDEVIHNYKLNNHRHTSICAPDIEWLAKHFFELGFSAGKESKI